MFYYYDTGEDYFKNTDIFINKCLVKECPVHAHSFIEIAFIVNGYGVHKVGNVVFPCTKGEIYIINHDIPHSFTSDETCHLEIYNCIFKPLFFNYSFVDSKKFYDITHDFLIHLLDGECHFITPKIMTSNATYNSITSIYDDMLSEYTFKDEGYIEILKADLVKLIIFILRIMQQEHSTPIPLSSKNKLLEKAIDYIHCNYYNQITIEELSMMAFLSKSHFCRLFKEYSGMTVKEYIQRIRINEACRLLRNSTLRISDISNEVGYYDLKYFISLFKKFTDKTPTEYRKEKS